MHLVQDPARLCAEVPIPCDRMIRALSGTPKRRRDTRNCNAPPESPVRSRVLWSRRSGTMISMARNLRPSSTICRNRLRRLPARPYRGSTLSVIPTSGRKSATVFLPVLPTCRPSFCVATGPRAVGTVGLTRGSGRVRSDLFQSIRPLIGRSVAAAGRVRGLGIRPS